MHGWSWLLVASATVSGVVAGAALDSETPFDGHSDGSVHLPIHRRARRSLRRRSGLNGQIGLGDYYDTSYDVILKIGSVETPFVLDTGSSDLWVVADTCTGSCKSSVPLYPISSFKSLGLGVEIDYGDSQLGTSATGLIGKDTVGLAGLTLQDQYFAAINSTNTSILDSGDAGIFGVGFPINSAILFEVFMDKYNLSTTSSLRRRTAGAGPGSSFWKRASKAFPSLDFLTTLTSPLFNANIHRREQIPVATALIQSYSLSGPFISRLALAGLLSSPQFTVTLQRDTAEVGGNVGLLSLGGLPPGVKNESLTWVDVRRYSKAEGGLEAPPESPGETYPISWEIFIDDVFLDGKKLPKSTLSPNISASALIDTGTSSILGPTDVISTILSTTGKSFPCSEPHVLAFQIGEKLFPVDVRDLVGQVEQGSTGRCVMPVDVTDVPSKGGLYSWNLGDPFLKSVLSTFYYGNITHPSEDGPRIGLLSTVPKDDGDQLKAIASSALAAHANLPYTRESAMAGVRSASATNSVGVLQAPTMAVAGGSGVRKGNGAVGVSGGGAFVGVVGVVLMLVVFV